MYKWINNIFNKASEVNKTKTPTQTTEKKKDTSENGKENREVPKRKYEEAFSFYLNNKGKPIKSS